VSKIQAVILAGGQGSRLRPYTTVLPKPLLPVADLPIAEIIVRQFRYYGLKHIAISTGHLAELIEAYFGDGRRWGVRIDYVREVHPMGTAGALKLVEGLADDFLVMNGDILTDINFHSLFSVHRKKGACATITVTERVVKTDFGVIRTQTDGCLAEYIEKPVQRMWVSTGINVLRADALRHLKKNEPLGMPDLMLRIKRAGEKIYCHKTGRFWLDLGRREDLEAAQDVFTEHKQKFLLGS